MGPRRQCGVIENLSVGEQVIPKDQYAIHFLELNHGHVIKIMIAIGILRVI